MIVYNDLWMPGEDLIPKVRQFCLGIVPSGVAHDFWHHCSSLKLRIVSTVSAFLCLIEVIAEDEDAARAVAQDVEECLHAGVELMRRENEWPWCKQRERRGRRQLLKVY